MVWVKCFTILVIWCAGTAASEEHSHLYTWRHEYYEAPMDHFNVSNSETFPLHYLTNLNHWDPNGGPIFFAPGGEGAIEEFAQHMGLMWDWAREFGAMLVFAEHRFYGHTLPYGNLSYEMPYLKTLTVEQAMADYADLLKWIKHNITGAANSSVIAFGGSYSGMLAAWMRLKYPSIITGAIASSAPFRQLIGGDAPCWAFSNRATVTFDKAAPKCVEVIQKSWDIISRRLRTDEGRQSLNDIFHTCNGTKIRPGPYLDSIMFRISDAWQYMAMFDYPYETNFVVPLPAWPVKEACKHLTADAADDEALLQNVYKATSIFYNHTGTLKCFSLRPVKTDSFARNWVYQTCTELALRLCNNATDILHDTDWNEDRYFNRCTTALKSEPRYDWITDNYGLRKLKRTTNIIFTNSELDPWYSSGLTQRQLKGADPSLVVINTPNAAHHYDLRASHVNDTEEVIDTRNRMKKIVHGWLAIPDKSRASGAACHSAFYSLVVCSISISIIVESFGHLLLQLFQCLL